MGTVPRLEIFATNLLVRESLATVLAKNERLAVVGQSGDLETARRQLAETVPDVLLVALGDADKIYRLVRDATREHQVRVLVLGEDDGTDRAVCCLEAGARGFVSFSASLDELAAAVETVLDGGVACSPAIVSRVLSRLSDLSNEYLRKRHAEAQSITPRELQILERIAEGDTNLAIAERLVLSPHTVKNHLYQLFRKLGVSNRSQAIQIGLQRGWLQRPGRENAASEHRGRRPAVGHLRSG